MGEKLSRGPLDSAILGWDGCGLLWWMLRISSAMMFMGDVVDEMRRADCKYKAGAMENEGDACLRTVYGI